MTDQPRQTREDQDNPSARQPQTQLHDPPRSAEASPAHPHQQRQLVEVVRENAAEQTQSQVAPPPYTPPARLNIQLMSRINMPPHLHIPEDSSSDSGSEDNTFRLDINSQIQIQGHGSIVGITPVNAAELTTEVVRMLNQQGVLPPSQDANAPRPRYEININSGVVVRGDRNIVGSNLTEVARYANMGRGQGAPNAQRTPSGQVTGDANANTGAGTPPQQQQRQGPSASTTSPNAAAGRSTHQHSPPKADNMDLYEDPPKPGQPR